MSVNLVFTPTHGKRLSGSVTAADGLSGTREIRHAEEEVPERTVDAHAGSPDVRVSDIQRARILAAMVDVASERGGGNVTVAHVVARSGVSRRTFYEIFQGREDCFLAALDDAIARIAAEVVPAYRQPGPWRERIRAGCARCSNTSTMTPRSRASCSSSPSRRGPARWSAAAACSPRSSPPWTRAGVKRRGARIHHP